MALRGVATLVLVADATGIDCSTAVCKADCECSNEKCADELATCLSDDTCAKSQECALACPCGSEGNACVLKCAAENPSSKALPAAACINKQCGDSVGAVAGIDCSTAACKEDCECSNEKCADELATCLSDETCAKSQECALACPCGSEGNACVLKCAAENPSSKALPAAACINKQCGDSVGAVAGIDCSTAVCKEDCECSNEKCADELATCLSDETCAKSQECALACPCGSEGNACVLKCAAENPSSKALPAAACINKQCGDSVGAVAGIDCSTAVCKADCECSNEKCADELATCLSDDTCAKSQECALACPCGSEGNACVLKCAAENPSSKALPAAACINKQCGDSVGVVV